MRIWKQSMALLFVAVVPLSLYGQQLVQRGPFGKPEQVMDETEHWSTPLLVAADPDVFIYIPDVSSPDWLQRNYQEFTNRGSYELSLFTFYRTPAACRANQIAWGLGDKAHLDACASNVGYRVRRAKVDPQGKSVTLRFAAMLDQSGVIDSTSVQDAGAFRTWDQLDTNTQAALKKANALITEQMRVYDRKVQSTR